MGTHTLALEQATWKRAAWKLLLAAIAAAPFLSLYVHHFLQGANIPTGFLAEDMAYYNANGRAVFERGNGLAYPNPYDPSPDAPIIYFHWFVWVLGYGIVCLGFDPGIQFAVLGVLAALLCARVTLALVEEILPDQRYRVPLYLLTMWGGGWLCLVQAYTNYLLHQPIGDELFLYDPVKGWWFLNWGRNLLFTTEALYHALVAACWLALLRRSWGWALVWAGLIAATHPFTGLETLLVVVAWLGLETLVARFRLSVLGPWLGAVALLGAFLAYYGWFLESYEQHRAMRSTWSLGWIIEPTTMLLADGPVAVLALLRLLLYPRQLGRRDAFLGIAFSIAFLLTNHHWFVTARQPIHFDRGYVWMPLCLLAVPLLQRTALALRARASGITFGLASMVVVALAISDNVGFLAYYWREPDLGIRLTPSQRAMFRWIDERHLHGVVVCSEPLLSYLSATYTPLRPYYGHWANTPDIVTRYTAILTWMQSPRPEPWVAETDYFLVPRARAASVLRGLSRNDPRDWQVVYENSDYALIGFTSR